MSKTTLILGVMSGTSLDGIDLALCRFTKLEDKFHYEILKTDFIPYNIKIKKNLSEAHKLDTYDFLILHKNYGSYIGKQINEFLINTKKPDYIASHGHTVFHNPNEKITFQIGDGAFISAETDISVISDFRNLDTALNGQGAPLVPIGDKYLFGEYDYCINLGGFANISTDIDDKRIAYDICPLNIVINKFADDLGFEFDKDGILAEKGKVNQMLLKELNNIPYYKLKYPKSLGREYVETVFYPIIDKYEICIYDKIRTFYNHISDQIIESISSDFQKKVLITGGGSHNKFLIKEYIMKSNHEIIIPGNQIIDFKEAIIFAFLGFLRISNTINTFKSVTGAQIDSIGGSVFLR